MPIRLLVAAAAVLLLTTSATAGKKKKYHFALAGVTAKDEVKADVAKQASGRVEGQIKKTFATHPQLVPNLEGAPPLPAKPTPKQMAAYRAFLKKKGITSAHLVTVELTEASAEVEPSDKPNTQRLVVRVGVHILGEAIPGKTMSFTGDGSATIKQEVGKKIRARDREYAWDSAAEVAIAEAMTTVFKQLAVPPKKQ